MHHARTRLIEHATALAAYREGQVGVLVIRGGVPGVEAADFAEQAGRDREGRTGTVIRVAQAGVAGILRCIEASVIPGRAIREHHATGFLQAPVRIDQLRTDQARVRVLVEGAHQFIQPAGLGQGVVVQENEQASFRPGGTVVAGRDESSIVRPAVVAQAVDLFHPALGLVAGAIIHHQDFHRAGGRMPGQCAQAGQGVVGLVVDRDDDAGDGSIRTGDGERGERGFGGPVQWPGRRRRRAHPMPPDALPGGLPSAGPQAGHTPVEQAAHAFEQEAHIGQ